MENNFYIYLHVKETTGEPFYIGKGKNTRFKSKGGRSEYWHRVVNKYGYDTIFLELNLNETDAFEKEIYWINRIGRRDLNEGPLINLMDGGQGGGNYWLGKNLSEETKNKISEKTKGNNNALGAIRSIEYRTKMSKSKSGKKLSEETKDKLKVICPHCNKQGSICVMKRWHFDNCKYNIIKNNN